MIAVFIYGHSAARLLSQYFTIKLRPVKSLAQVCLLSVKNIPCLTRVNDYTDLVLICVLFLNYVRNICSGVDIWLI